MTKKKITASERWFLKQMEEEEFRLEFHKARQERLFEEMKSLVVQTEVNLEEVIEGKIEELKTLDEGNQ